MARAHSRLAGTKKEPLSSILTAAARHGRARERQGNPLPPEGWKALLCHSEQQQLGPRMPSWGQLTL